MDLFEAIDKRYCYRDKLSDHPVPRADLQKIVETGLKAPSGKNEQTTTFVIVDDPALLDEIRKTHSMQAVQDARAIIFAVIPKPVKPADGGATFEIEDCAAATTQVLLAATALGYVSVWIDGQLRSEGRAEKYNRLLGVPEGRTCRVMMPIGVPAADGPRKRKKPFAERASFNRHV